MNYLKQKLSQQSTLTPLKGPLFESLSWAIVLNLHMNHCLEPLLHITMLNHHIESPYWMLWWNVALHRCVDSLCWVAVWNHNFVQLFQITVLNHRQEPLSWNTVLKHGVLQMNSKGSLTDLQEISKGSLWDLQGASKGSLRDLQGISKGSLRDL